MAAAARCEEVSRRFGLASLPMSLALQAVAHGLAGNRTAMEAAAAAARATGGDTATVEMIMLGNGIAVYHLGQGQLPTSRRRPGRGHGCAHEPRAVGAPVPGPVGLVRTVADDGGAEARAECRALDLDTAMSRATLAAADAVAAGREGGDANSMFAAADSALSVSTVASSAAWPGSWWHRVPTRTGGENRRRGCGPPWPTSRTWACPASPTSAGGALRAMDEPVPRRARPEAALVPVPWRRQG